MDSPPSIEDEDLLDEVNTILETPNTFGRCLIQRLGIAEAEAVSTFLNNNIKCNIIGKFYVPTLYVLYFHGLPHTISVEPSVA